ncbi:hypothetical protein D3C86_1542520 [compost metagenome]
MGFKAQCAYAMLWSSEAPHIIVSMHERTLLHEVVANLIRAKFPEWMNRIRIRLQCVPIGEYPTRLARR